MLSSMIVLIYTLLTVALLLAQSYHRFKNPLWLDRHDDVFPSFHCGMLSEPWMSILSLTIICRRTPNDL